MIGLLNPIVECCIEKEDPFPPTSVFAYYSVINRDLNRRPMFEYRCDTRPKTKTEGSTLLGYTGFLGELEPQNIKTRLIDELFSSVMGEYVCLK